MSNTTILDFNRRLVQEYNQSVGLDDNCRFLYGNPVLPVVPLDTKQDGVFILGAYPTAIFACIRGVRDVPVGNILRPFANEVYFDGCGVRHVEAGKELQEKYLNLLELKREQCWITNLVRLFLFKQGHINKYIQLGYLSGTSETRSRFETMAESEANLKWLYEELEIARPRVIIALGTEVAGILRGVKSQAKRNALLSGAVNRIMLNGIEYPCIHLAHPGIVMRPASRTNRWPTWHTEHCKSASAEIAQLLDSR